MALKSTVLILLACVSMCACVRERTPSDIVNYINTGDRVPEFSLDGGAFVSPDGFYGKAAMLVFFNTGCDDCRREMPKIYAVWESIINNDGDCLLIAIARGQTEEQVKAEWGFGDMPFFTDADRKVFDKFANSTIPRVYFVDPEGVVRWMAVEFLLSEDGGEMTAEELVSLFSGFKERAWNDNDERIP